MNPTPNPQQYSVPQMSVVQVSQSQLAKMEKYKTRIVNLGILEIILGGIIFILDIVMLIIAFDIGQGLWCGSVLIASGIVGVVTRSRPSYCMFAANMVLSILAAIFMGILLILSSIYASSYAVWYYDSNSAEVGLESTIAVMSFFALIVTILHSSYSCAGCCNPNSPSQVLMSGQMSNGQVIVIPNQMNQSVLSSGNVNPGMLVLPNQQGVASNAPVYLPGVLSTGPAPEQNAGYANPPPSFEYNPTR